MQYLAVRIIYDFWRKNLSAADLPLLEEITTQKDKSWWDSNDRMMYFFGDILKHDKHLRHQTANRYVKHDNMWLRRQSLTFQIGYRDHFDEEILFKNCEILCHEQDFFIRKAVGWALRDYSKTNARRTLDFVSQNQEKLSHLSKVEAVKYMLQRKDKYPDLTIPDFVKHQIK